MTSDTHCYRLSILDVQGDLNCKNPRVVAEVFFHEPGKPDADVMKKAQEGSEKIFNMYKDLDHIHTVDYAIATSDKKVHESLASALKQVEQIAEDKLTCDFDA